MSAIGERRRRRSRGPIIDLGRTLDLRGHRRGDRARRAGALAGRPRLPLRPGLPFRAAGRRRRDRGAAGRGRGSAPRRTPRPRSRPRRQRRPAQRRPRRSSAAPLGQRGLTPAPLRTPRLCRLDAAKRVAAQCVRPRLRTTVAPGRLPAGHRTRGDTMDTTDIDRAIEGAYTQHADEIRRRAFTLTRDAAAAEDLVQEAFLLGCSSTPASGLPRPSGLASARHDEPRDRSRPAPHRGGPQARGASAEPGRGIARDRGHRA